jgi:hypothetical protein
MRDWTAMKPPPSEVPQSEGSGTVGTLEDRSRSGGRALMARVRLLAVQQLANLAGKPFCIKSLRGRPDSELVHPLWARAARRPTAHCDQRGDTRPTPVERRVAPGRENTPEATRRWHPKSGGRAHQAGWSSRG